MNHSHHPCLAIQLKSGSFATVCRGTHRASGKKVAIKCVLRKDLPPSDDAVIYDEVAILASVEHAHIVPLIDFFDEKDCYFIVMELMCGGDLFDRIGKKKTYSEADARDLSSKMLKAMAYCHTRNIAHCDMKPKNLLLVVSFCGQMFAVVDDCLIAPLAPLTNGTLLFLFSFLRVMTTTRTSN